jgi:pimeloyl-ACP methyl ester carboxylesterase
MPTKVSTINADGINIFYRSAGNPNTPVLLLLHGFPSSSHQYRNLIPLLSQKYQVIAPDLPGFGFTDVPDSRQYQYNFANLTQTIGAFLDALKVTRFIIYIFDYGAPVGLRLALERPQAVLAIISQNGNAYLEGLGAFWDPIKAYWQSDSPVDREKLRTSLLTFNATKWQYEFGNPTPDAVPPESYFLDYALMQGTSNQNIQ